MYLKSGYYILIRWIFNKKDVEFSEPDYNVVSRPDGPMTL